ncbi:HDOD domain-containing protein [Desulfovibrio sulfodismutans]|uniref:HDOD domain-containing protein n=1 Tax=Desulfolutivibrio sulfodismutans TaxID=63561 RepID=A0A7K3NID1_9BACT|nr:HDOD domain-containing protein [Desulfolutivibrio sulfodismutans]NDY55961.1 HDOD domain-containing protein [Desulfolutivibrio sulfodismutans]QLA13205.1 HDOD domain-containing protein [Desulfolutivibrio sulfodismutans DSM 3696]
MAEDLRTERKGLILAVKDLPTLPKVLDEVARLVERSDSSTDEVAKLIAMDQVLSAKVLKMVNSPIYGFPGRISSIQHALVLLGFNVLRGIIVSTSVFEIMSENMVGLWEHSLGVALASSTVARAAGLRDPEEYSVAGLLHDLGKVVATVQLPELKGEIEQAVKARDLMYIEAEKEVLGFGHDRINAWLADHWKLPPNIKEGLSYHHKPQLARLYPDMACAVHVGDFMARVFEYGFGGDDNVPYLQPEALKRLKLKPADVEGILGHLSEQFLEISDLSFA